MRHSRGIGSLGASIAHRLLLIAAIGAILTAASEIWFYQIRLGPELIALVLIYGLFGYLFLLTLRLFQARAFATLFVAAGMFGFFIEGVPVPQLYLNLPFSIAWTSLAWHALFTVSLAYYLYRRVMAHSRWRAAVALNLGLGVAMGVWNAYLWNVIEDEAAGTISYAWHPVGEFAVQFLVGWALFMGGHLLLNRFAPQPVRPGPSEFLFFLGLAMLAWLLGNFLPFFPFSLILPILIVISLASLQAGLASPANGWLAAFFALRIPSQRLVLSLLIPGAAILTYALFAALRLEWETNVVVAGLAVPVSAIYWLYALLRANHAGHRTRPGPPPDLRLDER